MTEPTGTAGPVADTMDPTPARLSPTAPLRVAGFLATVLGAALMGGGAVMHWVTVHDPHDATGSLDLIYKGTDVRNGKLALVAAAVLLVGILVLRVVRSHSAQEAVAILMLLAALVSIAYAGAFLVDAGHRFFVQPTDKGTLGVGVLMTLAGGVVALLGAILDLAWSVSPH